MSLKTKTNKNPVTIFIYFSEMNQNFFSKPNKKEKNKTNRNNITAEALISEVIQTGN